MTYFSRSSRWRSFISKLSLSYDSASAPFAIWPVCSIYSAVICVSLVEDPVLSVLSESHRYNIVCANRNNCCYVFSVYEMLKQRGQRETNERNARYWISTASFFFVSSSWHWNWSWIDFLLHHISNSLYWCRPHSDFNYQLSARLNQSIVWEVGINQSLLRFSSYYVLDVLLIFKTELTALTKKEIVWKTSMC